MIKYVASFCLVAFVGALLLTVDSTSALGLKIAPLEYRTTLKKNEAQKGFIDVSNPSDESVVVKTSVQAFTQTDDNGALSFYDSKDLQRGLRTDLDSFILGPREALRMYFLADGAKLPQGDVFGAIFFTTQPTKQRNGVGQLVRVGTVFSIVNNTPGKRDAAITNLDLPWFQLNDTIKGSYSIKNTANTSENSGFFPKVSIDVWPGASKLVKEGSLTLAGRTRTNDFSYSTDGIGIHKVTVSYQESSQSRWVVTTTPIVLILIAIVLSLIVVELVLWRRRKLKKS